MRCFRKVPVCACLILLGGRDLAAHHAEPISTEFARPFTPGAGSQKIVYQYEREGEGASEHTIPELELELGVGRRWQVNLGFPLLRVKEGPEEPAAVAGGKLELGVRYLLFGGKAEKYAVSFQGTVEAPTGNRGLFGRTPELSPGLFVERYFGQRLRLHSNLSWRTTVGGTEEPEPVFEYKNALVWFAAQRWIPVIELLGATSNRTGETDFAIQPEIIVYGGPHLELKIGVPVGLTSHAPDIGVRAQVSILWGQKR